MNCMGTERPVSYCFFNVNAHLGFKPLAIGVHQAEQSNWCVAGKGSYFRNIVVVLFRFRSKNPVFTECFQAFCFVYGNFWDLQRRARSIVL